MVGGWFPFAFAVVYLVTMSNIFVEYALLALKYSVVICFLVSFILRLLLPESAKRMIYFLILVCFMMAQAYSVELDMANIADSTFINNIVQPLFFNVFPVAAGLLLGRVIKHVIDKVRKNK